MGRLIAQECMLASASALEFEKLVEEDLGSVSASVGDLIAVDSRDMAISHGISAFPPLQRWSRRC